MPPNIQHREQGDNLLPLAASLLPFKSNEVMPPLCAPTIKTRILREMSMLELEELEGRLVLSGFTSVPQSIPSQVSLIRSEHTSTVAPVSPNGGAGVNGGEAAGIPSPSANPAARGGNGPPGGGANLDNVSPALPPSPGPGNRPNAPFVDRPPDPALPMPQSFPGVGSASTGSNGNEKLSRSDPFQPSTSPVLSTDSTSSAPAPAGATGLEDGDRPMPTREAAAPLAALELGLQRFLEGLVPFGRDEVMLPAANLSALEAGLQQFLAGLVQAARPFASDREGSAFWLWGLAAATAAASAEIVRRERRRAAEARLAEATRLPGSSPEDFLHVKP